MALFRDECGHRVCEFADQSHQAERGKSITAGREQENVDFLRLLESTQMLKELRNKVLGDDAWCALPVGR